MIVCVAGNPSIDKLFLVDRLEAGSIHRPRDFVQVPGGKGLNVARAAAALGAEVAAVGILGGHAGRWVEEAFRAEGIAARFARCRGETRSSLSVADAETGRLTEFYEHGAPVEPEAWDVLEALLSDLLPTASWLTLSGSLPPGAPRDGYARLIRDAGRRAIPSALDARGPALGAGVTAGPNVVKVNAAEAGEMLGRPVRTETEALAAAAELRRTARAADELRTAAGVGGAGVVTRGEEGAVVVAPDGRAWAVRLDAWGPYPVGSGDSFLAGLVTALDRGSSWPEALALAAGAAAANAEVPGAGRLSPGRAVELAGLASVRPMPAPRA